MSKTEKTWERERPFQRIDSPAWEARPSRADGRGYDCGCHSPDQGPSFWREGPIDAWFAQELMRVLPGWVAADRAAPERLYELQGDLVRSFQTWTDMPGYQWHIWYDWNFHVKPDSPYDYLRGAGNDPETGHATGSNRRLVVRGKGSDTAPSDSMECEWDAGAIGPAPGPMFDGKFLWPMSGWPVWLAGRWIYDCGHATSNHTQDEVVWSDSVVRHIPVIGFAAHNTTRGKIVSEDANQVVVQEQSGNRVTIQRRHIIGNIRRAGLMRAELHPCKAVATAWWEAEKFDENEHYVPAIKFLFFASRFGGYKDFAALKPGDSAGKDFVFVVDLPETAGPEELTWKIGHTPDFPLNTGVLRSAMVWKSVEAPFATATGPGDGSRTGTVSSVKPKVELVETSDPGAKKRQAKITIPISEMAAADDAYGTIVSIGWLDPGNVQAQKVKECEVEITNFRRIRPDTDNHDCVLKTCINGRWFHWTHRIRNNQDYPLPGMKAKFWLHEDDAVRISAHGARTDGLHQFISRPRGRRTIWNNQTFGRGGHIAVWDQDIDTSNLTRCHDTLDGITDLFPMNSRNESEPLGLIDPGWGPAAESADNPLAIKGLAGGSPVTKTLTGFHTFADPHSAELFESTTTQEYKLTYKVTVKNQSI